MTPPISTRWGPLAPAIRAAAEGLGVSVSDLVRELVREGLARRGYVVPPTVSERVRGES